jgi:general secretion pathway protein G
MSTLASTRVRTPVVDGLIAAILLVVLAATVSPRGFGRERDGREVALLLDLQVLRSQIEIYRIQHGPHPGTPFARTMQSQMPDGVPLNLYTQGRAVWVVPDVDAVPPDEDAKVSGEPVGWIYSPTQGRIKANAAGLASDGRPLSAL